MTVVLLYYTFDTRVGHHVHKLSFPNSSSGKSSTQFRCLYKETSLMSSVGRDLHVRIARHLAVQPRRDRVRARGRRRSPGWFSRTCHKLFSIRLRASFRRGLRVGSSQRRGERILQLLEIKEEMNDERKICRPGVQRSQRIPPCLQPASHAPPKIIKYDIFQVLCWVNLIRHYQIMIFSMSREYGNISSAENQKGVNGVLRWSVWEPKGCYRHRLCTAIVPFCFSTEDRCRVIAPFWLSTDDIICFDISTFSGSPHPASPICNHGTFVVQVIVRLYIVKTFSNLLGYRRSPRHEDPSNHRSSLNRF